MKTIRFLAAAVAALFTSSCAYHLGGLKPQSMENMNTFCVEMFSNYTLQPSAGMLMTTAMANSLQSDGTYRMAPRSEADFIVKGEVTSISRESLTTSTEDSYVSTQIGIRVYVDYKIIDRKTGRAIVNSGTSAEGSYFNQVGSTQSSLETALSYATRRIAEKITLNLTTR